MSNMTTVRSTIRAVRASPTKGAANALALVGYINCEKQFAGEKVSKPHSPDELVFRNAIGLDGFQQDAEKLIRQLNDAEIASNGKYQMRGGKYPPLKDAEGKSVKDENGKVVVDKSNGRIAQPPELMKHLDLTIPHGATKKDAQEMVNSLAEFIRKKHNVAVIFAVHSKDGQPNDCHFLISKRTVSDSGEVGKTARTLTDKPKDKNSLSPVNEIRQVWANLAREKTGVEWSIRSYKERGIDLIPEPKLSNKKRAIGRRKTGVDPLQTVKRDRAFSRSLYENYKDQDPAPYDLDEVETKKPIKIKSVEPDYDFNDQVYLGDDIEETKPAKPVKTVPVVEPAQEKAPGIFKRVSNFFAARQEAKALEKQRLEDIEKAKQAAEAARVAAEKEAKEKERASWKRYAQSLKDKEIREEQERQKRIVAYEAKKAAQREEAKNRPRPQQGAKNAPVGRNGRNKGGRGVGD